MNTHSHFLSPVLSKARLPWPVPAWDKPLALCSRGWLTAALLTSSLIAAQNARADKIGLNFIGGDIFSGTPMASNERAGFVPQIFWNNAAGPKGTVGLEGDVGSSISAFYSGFSASWDSLNTGATGINDAPGDARLMKGFLLTRGVTQPGQLTVTVSGVPAALTSSGYAIILYFDGSDALASQVDAFTISAPGYGTKTRYALDPAGIDFSGQFRQIPDSSTTDQGSNTPSGNGLVFSGLKDSGFTVTVTSGTGGSAAVLNGLQIVDLGSLPAPPDPFSYAQVTTGTTNRLVSGSWADSDHGLLVTGNATLLTTTNAGSSWDLVNVGLNEDLRSVQGIGGYEFVAGTGGLIAVSFDSGLHWTKAATGVTNTFHALSFATPFSGYAVGSGGLIYFWDGTTWTRQASGVSSDFFGVVAIGSTAYVVGAGGIICRFNGVSWVPQNLGEASVDLYGVAFLNEDFGYAVGAQGAIYRTMDGGSHWASLVSGVNANLRGICIADVNTAWACGDNGVLLQTIDGGAHWTTNSLGTSVNWSGIVFVDGRGFVFGDGGMAYSFVYAAYAVNQAPTVSIIAPADGDGFLPCSKIPIAVRALDVDGSIAKLELFVGATKLGEWADSSGSAVWTNRATGTFTCTAKATDNSGAITWSAPVNLTVNLPGQDQLRALAMVSTNAFEFCLCGVPGHVYTVDRSTNVTDWTFWRTVTNVTGVLPMVDPELSRQRLYHAHSP